LEENRLGFFPGFVKHPINAMNGQTAPQKMKDEARSSTITPRFSGPRTGLNVEDIKQSLIDNLFCGMGRVPAVATRNDLYTALALTVRDRVLRHGVHVEVG
jgi:hypothetical protein